VINGPVNRHTAHRDQHTVPSPDADDGAADYARPRAENTGVAKCLAREAPSGVRLTDALLCIFCAFLCFDEPLRVCPAM